MALLNRSSIYSLDADELTKRIRDRVKLVDLMLDDKLPGIRQSDTEQQISCPFHGKDSSPSMRVYPGTNSCYCFTCKKSWDVVSYTMRRRGSSFLESLAYLVSSKSIPLDGIPQRIEKAKSKMNSGGGYASRMEEKTKVMTRDSVLFRLQGHVAALRGKIPTEAYGKIVYFLARAKFTEDASEFQEMARLVSSSVKKMIERTENGCDTANKLS